MALSADLLELLKELDHAELNVQYLMGHLDDVIDDEPPYATRQEEQGAEDTTIEIRQLVEMVVQAKRDPTFRIEPATIEWLRGIIPESYFDEYFTVQALASIPGVTARWKQLANLGFSTSPGTRTAGYIRQAVGCYLYGMYEAAAALCRTVLEFSLHEALGRRLGDLGQTGDANLDRLITFCARSSIITPALERKAHAIRKRGNDAIHAASCEPYDALTQLLETRDVLAHLYGEAD